MMFLDLGLWLMLLLSFSVMYIPEEMKKENRFLDVAIPTTKQLFARIGESAPLPSSFTGDEVALMNQDKIQQIEDYQSYAEQMAKQSD